MQTNDINCYARSIGGISYERERKRRNIRTKKRI